jgi:hypothetical protein
VFSSADFLSAGTRATVDQALHRMVRSGEIARVAIDEMSTRRRIHALHRYDFKSGHDRRSN